MFCENCGTKAQEGAKFCEECGSPLKTNKKEKKPRNPLSKKTKTIIIASICALIIIVWAVLTVFNRFTPETVALNYFRAYSNNDASALYDYLSVENKDFTSKKIYKKLMKNAKNKEITNYAATETSVSTDGLEANVTIKYIENGIKTKTTTVKLIKDAKKKMIIFDNWKVVSDIDVVNDYSIKVMKNSKVDIAGITLNESYLDKEKSTDNFDVYNIKSMLAAEYPAVVTFPMGIKIETNIKPSEYSKNTTLKFNLNDISKKDKESIQKAILENMQYIYNSALENKNFNDIKEKFITENSDAAETYTTFRDSLAKRASALESIKFKEITLNRVSVTDEGYLKVSFKVKYDYKTDKEDSSSAYSSITFDCNDNYKVVDFSNFKTYF